MLRNVRMWSLCGSLVFLVTTPAKAIELASLLGDPTNEIVIHDARFTNFRGFGSEGFDGGLAVGADRIEVSPLHFGDEVGLRFASPDFTVFQGQTQRTALRFDMQSPAPGRHAAGGALQLGPTFTGNG